MIEHTFFCQFLLQRKMKSTLENQYEISYWLKNAFTNYVYKRRGVCGQKKSTFCKLLYRRKCKRSGISGQKKTNLVNVVCEHPLKGPFISKCPLGVFKSPKKQQNKILQLTT